MLKFLNVNDFVQTMLDVTDPIDYPLGYLEQGHPYITFADGATDEVLPPLPFIAILTASQTQTGYFNSEAILCYEQQGLNPNRFLCVRNWNKYQSIDEIVGATTAGYLAGVTTIAVDTAPIVGNFFRLNFHDPRLYRVTGVAGLNVTFEPPLYEDATIGTAFRIVTDSRRDGFGDPIDSSRDHSGAEKVVILQLNSHLEELQDMVKQLASLQAPVDIVADTATLANHITIGGVKMGFPIVDGMIRYTGTKFQGREAGAWVDFYTIPGGGDTLPPGTLAGETIYYNGASWVATSIVSVDPAMVTITADGGVPFEFNTTAFSTSGNIEADQIRGNLFQITEGVVEPYVSLPDGFGLFFTNLGTESGLITYMEGGGGGARPVYLFGGVETPVAPGDTAVSIFSRGAMYLQTLDTGVAGSSMIRMLTDKLQVGNTAQWTFDTDTNLVTFNTPLLVNKVTLSQGQATWTPVVSYPASPTNGMMIYHNGDGFMVRQAGSWLPITGDTMTFAAPGTAWSTVHYNPDTLEWEYTEQLTIEPMGVRIQNALVVGPRNLAFPEELGLIEYVNGDLEAIVAGPDGIGPIRVSLTNLSPEQRLPSANETTGLMMYSRLNPQNRWTWYATSDPIWDHVNSRMIPLTLKIGDGAGDAGLIQWNTGLNRLEWYDGVTWFSLSTEATMPVPTEPGAFMVVDATTNWAETTIVSIQDGKFVTAVVETALLRLGPDEFDQFYEFSATSFTAPQVNSNNITNTGNITTQTMTVVGLLQVGELFVANEEEEGVTLNLDRLKLKDAAGGSPLFTLEPEPADFRILYENIDRMWSLRKAISDVYEGTIDGAHVLNATTINVNGILAVLEAGGIFKVNDVAYKILSTSGNPTTIITLATGLASALVGDEEFTVDYGSFEGTMWGKFIVEDDFRVKRLATFDYTIKLNNINDSDGEVDSVPDEPGMIRYNGDFQGRLANGQWTSFTRGMADGDFNPDFFGSLLYWNSAGWVKNTNFRADEYGGIRLYSNTSTPPVAGAMRFSGSDFQACINPGVWVTLTALEALPSLPSGGIYEGATLRWTGGNWVINPQLTSDGVTTESPMLQLRPFENFYASGYVLVGQPIDTITFTVVSTEPLFVDDVLLFQSHATEYTIIARSDLGGGEYEVSLNPALVESVFTNELVRVIGSTFLIGEGLLPRPLPAGGQLRYNQNDFQGFVEGIGWVSFTGHKSWLPNKQGDQFLVRGNLLYFDGSTWVASHNTFVSENFFNMEMDLEVTGDIGLTGDFRANGLLVGSPKNWRVEKQKLGDPISIPGFLYYNDMTKRFRGCVSDEDVIQWIDLVSPIQAVDPETGHTLYYDAETSFWLNTNQVLVNHTSHPEEYYVDFNFNTRGMTIGTEIIEVGEATYKEILFSYNDLETDTVTEFFVLQTGSEPGGEATAAFKMLVADTLLKKLLIQPSGDSFEDYNGYADFGTYSLVNTGKTKLGDKLVVTSGGATIAGNLYLPSGTINVESGDFVLHNGSIETDELYAHGRGTFRKSISIGYVETDGYLSPGTMRYSVPGENRGDFEGWDGQQWVSFTAGFHGQAIWQDDPPVSGALVAYDPDLEGGRYRNYNEGFVDLATDRLSIKALLTRSHIDYQAPPSLPTAAIGRSRFTGTDLQFSIDGVSWVSMLGYGTSGLPAALTSGSTIRWYETPTTFFSNATYVAGGIFGNTIVRVNMGGTPVVGMFLEYTLGKFYRIDAVAVLGGGNFDLTLDEGLRDIDTPLAPLQIHNGDAEWIVTEAIRVLGNRVHLNKVLELEPYEDMLPIAPAAAGQIRYNEGDYEGYIPQLGWASFTGKVPFQDPALHTGQFLRSNGTHWVADPNFNFGGGVYHLGVSGSGMTVLSSQIVNMPYMVYTNTVRVTGMMDTGNGAIGWNSNHHVMLQSGSWLPITFGRNLIEGSTIRDVPGVFYDITSKSFIGRDKFWYDPDSPGVVVLEGVDIRSGALTFGNSITGAATAWNYSTSAGTLKLQLDTDLYVQYSPTAGMTVYSDFTVDIASEFLVNSNATFTNYVTITSPEVSITSTNFIIESDTSITGNVTLDGSFTITGGLYVAGEQYANFDVVTSRTMQTIGYIGAGNDNPSGVWMGAIRYTGSHTCRTSSFVGQGSGLVPIKELVGPAPESILDEGRLMIQGDPKIYKIIDVSDQGGGNWTLVIPSPGLEKPIGGDTEVRLLTAGDFEGWNGTKWVSFTNYSTYGFNFMDYFPGVNEGDMIRWDDGTQEWELAIGLSNGPTGSLTILGGAYTNAIYNTVGIKKIDLVSSGSEIKIGEATTSAVTLQAGDLALTGVEQFQLTAEGLELSFDYSTNLFGVIMKLSAANTNAVSLDTTMIGQWLSLGDRGVTDHSDYGILIDQIESEFLVESAGTYAVTNTVITIVNVDPLFVPDLVGLQILDTIGGRSYPINAATFISGTTWSLTLAFGLFRGLAIGDELLLRHPTEYSRGLRADSPIEVYNSVKQNGFKSVLTPKYADLMTAYRSEIYPDTYENNNRELCGFGNYAEGPYSGTTTEFLTGFQTRFYHRGNFGQTGQVLEYTGFKMDAHSKNDGSNPYSTIRNMFGLKIGGFDLTGWNAPGPCNITGIFMYGTDLSTSGYRPFYRDFGDITPQQRLDSITGFLSYPMYSETAGNSIAGIKMYGPIGHNTQSTNVKGIWIGAPFADESTWYDTTGIGGIHGALTSGARGVDIEPLVWLKGQPAYYSANLTQTTKVPVFVAGISTTMGASDVSLGSPGTLATVITIQPSMSAEEVVAEDKHYSHYTKEGRVRFGGDMRAASIGVLPTGVNVTKPVDGYYRKGDIWIYGTISNAKMYVCVNSGRYLGSTIGNYVVDSAGVSTGIKMWNEFSGTVPNAL